MIKTTFCIATTALIGLASCQNGTQQNNDEYKALSQEAIEVHDEIMPQITRFDKTSVKIDSILANLPELKAKRPDLDTTATRSDLTTLQSNADAATDFMMEWMKTYVPDSADIAYQRSEIERINLMKKQFDEVNKEIDDKLKHFN